MFLNNKAKVKSKAIIDYNRVYPSGIYRKYMALIYDEYFQPVTPKVSAANQSVLDQKRLKVVHSNWFFGYIIKLCAQNVQVTRIAEARIENNFGFREVDYI